MPSVRQSSRGWPAPASPAIVPVQRRRGGRQTQHDRVLALCAVNSTDSMTADFHPPT